MAGRAKLLAILFFILAPAAYSQGIPYQLNPPAPNARVQFCPVPDGGYPCPTLTTVYSDSAATQVINQPISTGSSGNLSVYFAAGTSSITVQLLGQGYGPQNRFVVALGGGSGGITGQQDITKNGAVSGKSVTDGSMATTSSTFSANGNSTSPATPSGTTTFNNEVVVSMYSLNAAFTPPGTPTARASVAFAAATNEGVWIGDQTVASAGAYAANTGTTTSNTWAAAAIPLIPKSGQTISFTTSATNHTTGSSVTVVFSATAGQTLIACLAGFNGYTPTFGSNWTLIVSNQNSSSQFLTCAIHQAGASEPGSYTFSGTVGTFLGAAIVEYANVAAIDNTLTSASASWSAADVGKTICAESLNAVGGAGALNCGPLNLVSNATTIYPLFTNTQTSAVSNIAVMWGSDSTPGFTGALTALGSLGGNLYIPPGIFFLTAGQLKLPFNTTVNVIGAGAQATVGNGNANGTGGSFIVGIPDSANDPIIGFVTGPGTGTQIYQTNDLIQGITIRSNKTGTGNCINVGMEFMLIQKNDLIGCGGDAINFQLNNTVFTGLDAVKQNLIEYAGNYGVDIATSSLGANYVIEGNEMDFMVAGDILIGGAQQVTVSNNQLQFGGEAVTVTNTGSTPVTIGPGNWIDGQIHYTASGGPGPDIFDNFFELTQMINLNGQVGAKITGNNFSVGTPFNVSSTQKNLTMDATNTGGGFTQSFSGTSGTASCVFSLAGGQARGTCFLNGYAETGTAQTWTYPLALATSPFLTESGGSCGAQNPSTSATVLTLPANAAMTAETCQIIVEGQTN